MSIDAQKEHGEKVRKDLNVYRLRLTVGRGPVPRQRRSHRRAGSPNPDLFAIRRSRTTEAARHHLTLRNADAFGVPQRYSPTSMSNSRPFNGCTGRLLRWIMAANAEICVSAISIGVVSTNQLTPSEHGGVVNEPS